MNEHEMTCTIDKSDATCRRAPARTAAHRKTAALLAAAGLACTACLIPGLAIGGAGLLAGAALDPDRVLFAVAALGLAGYALLTLLRRSRAANSGAGCGC